jgi:hypothetical protein
MSRRSARMSASAKPRWPKRWSRKNARRTKTRS